MEYKRCPKCGEKAGYLRKTTKDYRCGQCKKVFPKIEEETKQPEIIETREKEPDLKCIEMTKEEAQKEWEEYREVLRDRKEKYLEDMYSCLSQMRRGRKIIDLFEVMKEVGVNEKQQPKLAIAKADESNVTFHKKEQGRGTFESGRESNYIWLPEKTFPEWNKIKPNEAHSWQNEFIEERLRAKVPIVPAHFLPRGSLNGYYLLWEVDDWEVLPKDPILLKRITKNLFAVFGAWDLTPLEQAIMKDKR